jgi:alpha-tubulin suppressor-like RCC1 family protein
MPLSRFISPSARSAARSTRRWSAAFAAMITMSALTVIGGILPQASAAGQQWRQVSAGGWQTCAIRTDGTLWCWGTDGTVGDIDEHVWVPTQVSARTDWDSVVVGSNHACALTSRGARFCWGDNQGGQLGLGDAPQYEPTPVQAGSSDPVWLSLGAGGYSTCGISNLHQLWCWGNGGFGQLGLGDTISRSSPSQVGARSDWASVVLGTVHTCALTTDGTRYCWGLNSAGELGQGTVDTDVHTVPVALTGDAGWLSLSLGERHSCGLLAVNRHIYCWGENSSGQLGDGDHTNESFPTQIANTATWRAVQAGAASTCGIYGNGTRFCWGDNQNGTLGIGDWTNRAKPIRLIDGWVWAQLTIGSGHACGIRTDGALYCWGANFFGQLGTGNTTNRNRPTAVG